MSGAIAAVREGLYRVERELRSADLPVPSWEGKLIRPVVGWAAARQLGAGARGSAGEIRLWRALAAVQLAHEASLLHDDVVDAAPQRRGAPTLAASRGVAVALVEGDHLLTTAYRLAADAGSLEWATLFARAVERTVAGEKAQAAAAGRRLDRAAYEAIVLGKSGELLGAALAAPAVLAGSPASPAHYELGRRLGLVYQMLDDLLDYCPGATPGKAALADRQRGLWTWPLEFVDAPPEVPAVDVVGLFGRRDGRGAVPAERALARLRGEAARTAAAARALLPGDEVLRELLDEWIGRAEEAVATLVEAPAAAGRSRDPDAPSAGPTFPESAHRGVDLPDVGDWERYLARHARSFHFAARLFPAERRRAVAGVYAWCRYTDELVDGSPLPRAVLEARLDAWLALSRRAYAGERTGHELADRVMAQMREAGVPFRYAEDLIDGMRMDVRGEVYGTLSDLFRYTYRVASVVGLWLCELFEIRDPWMLGRAAALGHAMQLTNIARDVGEDLRRGRVYLPAEWLAAHDLTRGELERMAEAGRVDDRYRALMTRLLEAADEQYQLAAAAVPLLPGFFRRPVAVAAAVYRGIHDAIRANGYDTLSRRAYTTLPQKLRLGAGGLWRAARERGRPRAYLRIAAAVGLVLMALLAGTALLGQAPAPVAPDSDRPAHSEDPALMELARLWVRAVDYKPAVGAGLAAIDTLRALRAPTRSSHLDLLLRAYEGSFLALRAKHGGWPPARLRALRDGFALMDTAVAEAPNAPDLRYIRLLSGFYLPGIFGRKAEVEQDMSALIRLLPDTAAAFPAAALPSVVTFLLQKGRPSPEERQALEALLR